MIEVLTLKEPKSPITSPADLFKKIQKIKVDYTQENFILICLNAKNQVIYNEVVFKGGLDNCLIEPKILFRKALIKNSHSIIFAHNHPSNDLKPSQEDKEVYKTLNEIGEILGLKVLDSIIFNKKEFFSLLNDIEVLN